MRFLRCCFALPLIRLHKPVNFVSTIAMSKIPAPPSSTLNEFGTTLQTNFLAQFKGIEEEGVKEDAINEVIFRSIRLLNSSVSSNNVADTDIIVSQTNDLLKLISNDPVKREVKLSQLFEKFAVSRMFKYFLNHGKLAPQSEIQPCNDDEYIGASLSLAQEISRYVLGRACENDSASVVISRELVTSLHGKMLEFDFRNGPLRRKYDGLKYALKNIEDIYFELSLQNDDIAAEAAGEPSAKKAKLDDVSSGDSPAVDAPFDGSELEQIRLRMEAYDKLREQMIKDTRDVQKLSKQAIFSVHRGQLTEAKTKLDLAEKTVRKILEAVKDFPTLRHGALSNCLEEWAEGKMTLVWVTEKRVMTKQEMEPLINTAEYVGAVSDFTGEIGRLAVLHASKRDLQAVREIQQVDAVLSAAITQINGNFKYNKKLDAMLTNQKKVEDVIYELCMLQRSGRRVRTAPDLSATVAAGPEDKMEE